jgi:DNA-binding FadR family transcriptional regulator
MSTTSGVIQPGHSHELAELILEHVARDSALPGTRLPTERQLAADFNVTRTMIRHALALLEAEGRISREVGRGTFLQHARARAIAAPVGGAAARSVDVGPADVMAARRVLEPQVLPLVIAWATNRDFDEMRRCLDGGAAAQSYEEFEVWDFALHHAIVVASRNPLLLAMYCEVERARRGSIWGNLKRLSDSRERRAVYHAEHVALVEAITARDLSRASELMEAHLATVEANLLGAAQQSDD